MVAPTASPSGISGSLVMVDSSGGCTKCAVLFARIRELESQLEEEKKAKESMAECLDNTFASLANEFENHNSKDARMANLTAQLLDATKQLDAKSHDDAAKKLAKSMDEFRREILADKTALQQELDKVKQTEIGKADPEASNDQNDEVQYLKAALKEANLAIHHRDVQLQEAITRFGKPIDWINSEVEDSFCSSHPTTDDIKQPSTKDVALDTTNLSNQLLEAKKAISLLKNARVTANRVLSENFQTAHEQLRNINQQYWRLVQDLEREKCNLVNSEQEKAYLRNHINYIIHEKENLGVRLAEANRRVSENRVSEEKLKVKVAEQAGQIEKLREKKERLKLKISQKEMEKNRRLQKMGERDSTPTTEPATPRSPMTPKSPATPESPVDEKRGSKRRSDEYECGEHKKQKN